MPGSLVIPYDYEIEKIILLTCLLLRKENMNVYQLKVSIIGIPRVYRTIEISDNCTFDDLHAIIFEAFDRYDPHLYSFFLTGKNTKSTAQIYNSPEITHPQNVEDFMGFGRKKPSAARKRIGDIDLAEIGTFHYLFDFGDDWWHTIRVLSVRNEKVRKKIKRIVKSAGESPPQYPEYNDDYED